MCFVFCWSGDNNDKKIARHLPRSVHHKNKILSTLFFIFFHVCFYFISGLSFSSSVMITCPSFPSMVTTASCTSSCPSVNSALILLYLFERFSPIAAKFFYHPLHYIIRIIIMVKYYFCFTYLYCYFILLCFLHLTATVGKFFFPGSPKYFFIVVRCSIC